MIGSLNVQSIKTNEYNETKILELIKLISNYDIFCLNETWINSKTTLVNKFKYSNTKICNNYIIHTDHSTSSQDQNYNGKGTAIFISKRWTPFYQKTFQIDQRLTGITLKRLTEKIHILSIYYPNDNKAKKELQPQLTTLLNQFQPSDRIIIVGDFNTTLNPSKDRILIDNTIQTQTCSTKQTSDDKFINKLVSHHSTTSFIDIWRLLNPNIFDFTHSRTTNNTTSQARIDFFLISPNLINHVSNATIETHNIQSNHKLITLQIQLPMNRLESKYGCSIKTEHFKLLASPPQDAITKYNNIIKQTLLDKKIIEIQSEPNNIIHNNNKANRIFKKTIRTAAKNALPITRYTTSSNTFNTNLKIHPTIRKMYKHIATLQKLQKQFRLSRHLFPNQITQVNPIHNLDLNIYNEENQDHTTEKTKQSIISKNHCTCNSTRINLQIECSIKRIRTFLKRTKKLRLKYILKTRLTQVAYNQKRFIQQVMEKNKQKFSLNFIKNKATGHLTTNPKAIKEAITNHYQQLFTEPDNMITENEILTNPQWGDSFLVQEHNNSYFSNIMDPFTIQELHETINDKNNQSAPGPDQLTYEHFKYLQEATILNTLLKLLNNSLEHNTWPEENNEATIILLLKKDHYTGSTKELRPITLLQTIR